MPISVFNSANKKLKESEDAEPPNQTNLKQKNKLNVNQQLLLQQIVSHHMKQVKEEIN
jgi:hypothetical protein